MKSLNIVPIFIAVVFISIISIIVVSIGASIYEDTFTENLTATVKEKASQMVSEGKTIKTRYLIITDKETFELQDNIVQGKFNNADIFYNIEEGKKYEFKVSGIGKSFLFNYRNILEARKIE